MHRIGIRGRVLIVFTVVHVVTGLVIGVLLFRSTAASVERELESIGSTLACNIADASADMVLTESYFDLWDLLRTSCCATGDDVSYLFVVDRTGAVVAHTFSEGFPVDLLAVRRDDPTAKGSVRLETDKGPIRDFVAPILDGRAGAVRLGLPEARIAAAARATLAEVLVLSLITYAVGVAGVILLTTLVTRPLRRLTQVAERISRGDLRPEIDIRAGGEIGKLSASFEHMLAGLEARTRALAAAERMAAVGELAAGVAHEINNPLDGVQNCLRQHERGRADDPKCREFLALIKEGLVRMETVVRQLLTFAKDEKSKRQMVDADAVVRNSLVFVEHRASKKRCKLSFDTNGKLPTIWADERGLHQVIVNLVMNAIDSVEDGGEVRIRTVAANDGVTIEVADTGAGMTEEVRSRMFEPFFTTKEVGKGTGLGLSVSKNIVDAHGGTIDVETIPGKGSVFTVTLPHGDKHDGTAD
ncbi:MAG: ATP-binding protein [Planctomycetota bacterium]|jgi:two-component system NtrC family sensor kinase